MTFFWAVSRAFLASCLALSLFSINCRIFWASVVGFRVGVSMPFWLSVIHSLLPGMSVTTAGMLRVIASRRLADVPSESEVETYMSEALR